LRDPVVADLSLRRGVLGFEAYAFVTAVAERFVFRMTAAAKVNGRELVFLMLFTLVVEDFGSAVHLIGPVLQYTNDDISHSFLLL
jgi:hypothetical protein